MIGKRDAAGVAKHAVATSKTFTFTTSSTPVRRQRSRLSRPSRHLHPSPQGPAALPSPPELRDGNYRHDRNPPAQPQAYPTQTPSTYGQPPAAGSGGSGLEEPRAFHPPTLSSQILHPAARHHHHHHQQAHHGSPQQQGSVVMDLHDQVQHEDTGLYSRVSLHSNFKPFFFEFLNSSRPIFQSPTR